VEQTPTATLDVRVVSEACGGPSLVALLEQHVSQLPPGGILEVLTGAGDQTFAVVTWSKRHGLRVIAERSLGRGAAVTLTHDGSPDDQP
jgi:TusA-related sulfurtransferase